MYTCIDTIPQLSAHNPGIIDIPTIITHCPPCSIDADLHSACTWQRSASQTHSSISTTLGSYGDTYKELLYNSRHTGQQASIPGLPCFCSSICVPLLCIIQTEEQNTGEAWERGYTGLPNSVLFSWAEIFVKS